MTRSASYSTMPGTFAPADHAGPKSHYFQPPHTSSASSSIHLSRSIASMVSDSTDRPTLAGRKRSRHDYSVESNATPVSTIGDWANITDTADSMAKSESMDPGSPTPFVSTRYQLSGGLDTPGAAAAAAYDVAESEYSETGYRKNLGDGLGIQPLENGDSHYFPLTTAAQLTNTNGRPRLQSYESTPVGWGKVALDAVGGVVGKVWEFCKGGAFRGFTAGGGSSYGINPSSQPHTPVQSTPRENETDEKDTIFGRSANRETTPMPGQFQDDDFISNYLEQRNLESTPPRPSKRLQISHDEGELARNWIMVSNNTTPNVSTPRSVARPAARYSMPTASSAGRRSQGNAAARPIASRANSRRPLLQGNRPSLVSHAGSPGLHSARPASFASPRSPGGSRIPMPTTSTQMKNVNGHIRQVSSTTSPASIEAQKWAVKMKKEEVEQDESIRRLNAQLKAMIRQGKEALGTKVEVDEVDELVMEEVQDDGFEDSEYTVSGKWVP